MVTIRTANEIVLNLIDFFKVTIPDADVKPGTVIRDLFIDAPASQLSLLYDELAKVSNLQSLRLVAATDLDRLAQNFGATRKVSVPSSGVALFTFASVPAVISINKGDLITGSSGATFSVINGISVDPAQLNSYRSIAIKYQNDLSFLNITDQYAVEVSVKATTPGASGNIAKYTLNTTAIPGVSNVTNVSPFSGGSDQEDDSTFRNRVLSIFSGSNVGTALGYQNIALANSSVQDAIVISPGDPLMTRDGTQVKQNSDGSFTVISEGTGGKIDVVILGTSISQFTDTFIYRDQSNNNDPTDSSNIFLLGQITGDAGKTISQKRLDDIANGAVPAQPVQEILEVTGSLSGTNFIPKSVDSLGRITGNYELIKDTGSYGGSPFGFDKFHWVSNKISLFQEDRVKSKFNGQDNTTFTDVLTIPTIQQNIPVLSENSLVSASDRSIVQLIHTPATNVTRVFNSNTGERYTVTNQNLDGTGTVNSTGRIQITGSTLPSSSDILQVDYTWIVDYDAFSDYDGKFLDNNPRTITDSIDWGMANEIRSERTLFTKNSTSTFYTGTVELPVSSVVSTNKFSSTVGVVSQSIVPNFATRLAITLTALDGPINSISSIKLLNSNEELFDTAENDGFILNTRVVVGINIKYNVTIVLPFDTDAVIGNNTLITYNASDAFNVPNSTGTFVQNQITVPFNNIAGTSSVYLDVTYVAAVQDILSVGITSLPLSRSGNGYIANSNIGSLNQVQSNTVKRENQTIQKNISNQLFVTLGISANDYSLDGYGIISVVDLVDDLEIWNNDFPGTITNDINNNYQLIFSGFNAPQVGDNVMIVYFATDTGRNQPFTFANTIIKKDFESLQFDFINNDFFVPIHTFTIETGMTFDIIDSTTGLSIGHGTDGYIGSTISSGSKALFASSAFNFSTISDLTGKLLKLSIPSNRNNGGTYNIFSYNNSTNTITIAIDSFNLSETQVSVIRVVDDKDIWNSSCNIDAVNNLLTLPATTLAAAGDPVMVLLFSNKNLHQSPTKLSITTADQVTNTGIITIYGTTVTKVADVVFTAINNGLKQNILEAIRTFIGSNSNFQLASNSFLTRLVKLEKVSTTTNNDVLSVLSQYDVINTKINNNLFYANETLKSDSITNIEFILPSTQNNITNIPQIGDKLRITFYYATNNDFENVYFTKNGTLYTNKKFALIEKVYASSGFSSSQSTKLTLSYFTQPATGSRYKAFYDYLAPKQNERILINYNYNKLISDVTFSIENQRPINADVLVRASKELLVDATMNIVVKSDFQNSSKIVLQNVRDKLISTINTGKLGDVLNSSDLIAAAQAVSGVDRTRILSFNESGKVGQVLTLTLQRDQEFIANNVVVNEESR